MSVTWIKGGLAVACALGLAVWTWATVAWVTERFGIFDDDLLGGTISVIPMAAVLATVVLLALPALAVQARRFAIGFAVAMTLLMVAAAGDNMAGALRDDTISPEGWAVAAITVALIGIVSALTVVVAREDPRRSRNA